MQFSGGTSDIDDLSYQKLGISTLQTFPRKYVATALEKIQKTKPKIVIMDLFIQPDDRDKEANEALAKAIGMGKTSLMKWEDENRAIPKSQRNESNEIKYHNDPLFSSQATIEISPFRLSILGVSAYISLNDENLTTIDDRIPIRKALKAAGINALAEPGKRDFINFYGEPNVIPSHSISEVLSNDVNLQDKIVVMGIKSFSKTDAPGAHDISPTSGSMFENYFGAEVHATVIGNLLDGSYIKRIPEAAERTLLAVTMILILLFLLRNPSKTALLSICLIWFIATYLVFAFYNILLPGAFFFLIFGIIGYAIASDSNAQETRSDILEAEEAFGMKLRRRIK